MSQEPFVWIIGICVLIFTASLILQGLAGLQILRIIRPLLQKNRQLMNESKHLVQMSQATVRDARPGVSITVAKARELANTTAAQIGARKLQVQGLTRPPRRLHSFHRPKPRRTQTPDKV
jgi:hypothetical protein